MGKREGLSVSASCASPEARWVRTNRQSLKSSLSEMRESGTLLTFNRTRLRFACLGTTQPSPVGSSAFSAEGPALCGYYQAGLSHYAAKPLAKSMALRQKREDQSKRISQPSYSRSHARSLEASDRRLNQAGQADDRPDRRSYVPVEERGRRLQAERRWKAETIRKKEIQPAKIKLGHYPAGHSFSFSISRVDAK